MSDAKSPQHPSRRAENDRAVVALELIFQANDEPPRIGTLEDLSAGGARIEATKPCREGEVIVVYLPWPSRDEPTTVTAVVRWVDGNRMGIQFSMTGAADSDAIAKLRDAGGVPAPKKRPAPTSGDDQFSRDALLAIPDSVHSMERHVRFQEVDAAGTIYYSRVFEYFGDVYVDLFDRGGVSLPLTMAKREWFAPLVHAEAEYLAPMRFGDAVVVHVVKVRCGTSAATVGYRIVSANGRPLAVGHTVHVFVDGTTFRPCPIPPPVLRALTATASSEA
jgi:1,4-dihydroxy-2-naphthoyl-CoA hydrolase